MIPFGSHNLYEVIPSPIQGDLTENNNFTKKYSIIDTQNFPLIGDKRTPKAYMELNEVIFAV